MTRRNRKRHYSTARGTTTRHTVYFHGRSIEVVVTNDVTDADAWVQTVRRLYAPQMVVGLDCEWRPNHVRGRRENPVAVLQLCAEDHCLVLQLLHTAGGCPAVVRSFLESDEALFVGVEVENDVDKLAVDYGICCWSYTDLNEPCLDYMAEMGNHLGLSRRRLGLKRYAWEVLGIEMEKPRRVTMSDWEAATLSDEQIEYACIDAYVSHALGWQVCDYLW